MEVTDEALGTAVPAVRELLSGAALPSLRLTVAGTCAWDSPGTRLGGVPLLAPGTAWPRSPSGYPQSFIGQLNSDDVNARLGNTDLPPGTVLAFFYDLVDERWGFDPKDAGHWRVLVSPIAQAHPLATPSGTESFEAHAVSARLVSTVPERWEPLVQPVRDDAFFNSLGEHPGNNEDAPHHRVFGWPEPVQNPMQLECHLVSNGIYCGDPSGFQDHRAARLAPGAADWILLWQIDSDDEAGWMWGDVGRLYYWIRRQDLEAGTFDHVWFIQQCS